MKFFRIEVCSFVTELLQFGIGLDHTCIDLKNFQQLNPVTEFMKDLVDELFTFSRSICPTE